MAALTYRGVRASTVREALDAPATMPSGTEQVELAAHGITHEAAGYFVAVTPNSYTVYRPSPSSTHAVPDSSYPRTADGHSLAVARCNYLARWG